MYLCVHICTYIYIHFLYPFSCQLTLKWFSCPMFLDIVTNAAVNRGVGEVSNQGSDFVSFEYISRRRIYVSHGSSILIF